MITISKMSDKTFQQKAAASFNVDSYDTTTGIKCPRPDCDEIVVYNGNYFCKCGWAAPERNEKAMTDAQLIFVDMLLEGLREARGE